MANFDEKIKFEVTKAFRNKIICQYCEIFPRPGVKMMICSSCTKLLCQNCQGTACPLCQYKSKDKKSSTFIEHPLLMEICSGFKTHPCINIKNGCLEEIPAKMGELEAHTQSCIFQMVPCPKMDCKETFIFKDLDEHLKQAHLYFAFGLRSLGVEGNTCREGAKGARDAMASPIFQNLLNKSGS